MNDSVLNGCISIRDPGMSDVSRQGDGCAMTPKQYAALPMRKLVRQLEGDTIPDNLYPPGWLERADAIEHGHAIPREYVKGWAYADAVWTFRPIRGESSYGPEDARSYGTYRYPPKAS